ncbi:hypothetical protein B0H11DRAFT_2230849 [Mycena galericulata]|nr:hypothetical protein B0H11DRAFT_2230849 [Mycena galericulata]
MSRCSLQTELPVSLVFCFEGMEENGSDGLDMLGVVKEKVVWFKDVICCSLLNTHTTVITYTLCGFAYFTLAPRYAQTSNAAASAAPCTSITNLTTLTARLADPAVKIRVHGVTKSSLIADVDSTPGVPIALSASKTHVVMGSRRSTVIPVNIWWVVKPLIFLFLKEQPPPFSPDILQLYRFRSRKGLKNI